MTAERAFRWKGVGMGQYSCTRCQNVVSGNHHEICPHCYALMDVPEDNDKNIWEQLEQEFINFEKRIKHE